MAALALCDDRSRSQCLPLKLRLIYPERKFAKLYTSWLDSGIPAPRYEQKNVTSAAAKMLKSVAQSHAPSVTELMNLSIQSGCFTVTWKLSTPIPKSGERTNPCNYRPISLLPILSKLLERHIYQIIYEHILQEDIFPECQWGFLSGIDHYSIISNNL